MAYVSICWGKSASYHLNYISKDRGQDDVVSSHDCSIETATKDFRSVRNEHHQQNGNQVLHVVQSFSAEDSTRLTSDQYHDIGTKLAEANFPGHQFVIRTHTDTDKIHNHIVINTVHSETGKKIENKKALIQKLRDSSDTFCKERGLSIINQEAIERRARLPTKVQQMVRAGKKSYIFDLAQKADVARSVATSFDEYRDVLSGFGIRTVIEEKNISYFYPGKEKGKRGSKLGRDYDKSGLIDAFRSNDEKFARTPGLKATFYKECEQIQKHGMPKTQEGMSHFTHLWDGTGRPWKDHSQFTKISRRESAQFHSDKELLSNFVPASEVQRARYHNIIDYCRLNKIELALNERGEKVFKGKEFVTVSEYQFKNNRNGTYGSIIDLVANHKNISLLQAVAQINGNSRLKLLEQKAGEVKHSYKSFYLPKEKRANWQDSVQRAASFLQSFGANSKHAELFHEKQLMHTDSRGHLWLFSKDHARGALEYVQDSAGQWNKTKHGSSRSPFYSVSGSSPTAVIFFTPESLLAKMGEHLFGIAKKRVGILGLLDSDERAIDHYVAKNKHVQTLIFAPSGSKSLSPAELDFFNNLKAKYKSFGIALDHVSNERTLDRALERRSHDFGLSL